jgi:hypothetical protein
MRSTSTVGGWISILRPLNSRKRLKNRLLSGEDAVVQGPFFFADGVELQSLVGRYRETWIMAVVPRDATAKMPDANLLELTTHHWVLMYRNKDGSKNTLATGEY